MRRVEGYPVDAAMGGCFIRRMHAESGEFVLDTDVDLDDLPTYGRLCLSAPAIQSMVTAMGWELLTPEMRDEHEATVEALSDKCQEVAELIEAVDAMVNVAAIQHAVEVVARRSSDRESIGSWVESLEPAR
jgi:hypothetical protein